ncbi:hypothetical protein VSR82_37225 [Burkholderia sp. JPY481]
MVMAFQETATGLNVWRFIACDTAIKGVKDFLSPFAGGASGKKNENSNPLLFANLSQI